MSGNDDPLDRLLGSIRRQKHTTTEDLSFLRKLKLADGGPEARGLNPLDLLALPHAERDLVNYLSRKKQATLDDLQQKLSSQMPAEVVQVIEALKGKGYLHEALVDGVLYYRVVFGGKVSRSGRGVPEDIWNAIDLDNTIFLRQHPLFNHLTEPQLKQIAAAMNARRYNRNEVIIWQGDIGDSVYFIKNGIVGISRLSPNSSAQDAPIFAYLKQGDILAEHNLLEEHQYPASATATALSEVDLLHIQRQDFVNLLLQYDNMALELAHLLAERLEAINRRLNTHEADTRLALIFGVGAAGATTLGSTLAMTLAELTKRKTVYTEHPNPDALRGIFAFASTNECFAHPAGYDIAVIGGAMGMPATVRTTLVMDRLLNDYANIVIGLPGKVDESVAYMLEKANQVVILTEPDTTSWLKMNRLLASVKAGIHPERTSILIVVSHNQPTNTVIPLPGHVDLEIPFLPDLPSPAEQRRDNLPAALINVATRLADRLGRTNQIGIYIPTTVDVNQAVDTSGYIQETTTFLEELFGGAMATASEAHGVWNSEEIGLVSETIHIIRTYVTQTELDRYLGDVLEYVAKLKGELKQEAMALEVNNKLMLI